MVESRWWKSNLILIINFGETGSIHFWSSSHYTLSWSHESYILLPNFNKVWWVPAQCFRQTLSPSYNSLILFTITIQNYKFPSLILIFSVYNNWLIFLPKHKVTFNELFHRLINKNTHFFSSGWLYDGRVPQSFSSAKGGRLAEDSPTSNPTERPICSAHSTASSNQSRFEPRGGNQ